MSIKAIRGILQSDLTPTRKLELIENVVDAVSQFLQEAPAPGARCAEALQASLTRAGAIAGVDRGRVAAVVSHGVKWLIHNVHQDGGWGWKVRDRVPFSKLARTPGRSPSLAWDTAIGILALDQWDRFHASDPGVTRAIERGRQWLLAHQNSDGGWGGLVRLRRDSLSNAIETGLALWVLGQTESADAAATTKALEFLATLRNPDGGWALEAGQQSDAKSSAIVVAVGYLYSTGVRDRSAAVEWLLNSQRPDGNWVMPSRLVGGIDPTFYAMGALQIDHHHTKDFRASQAIARALRWYRDTAHLVHRGRKVGWGWGTLESTASAVASLLNCGEPEDSPDVEKGVEWLVTRHHEREAWAYDTPVSIISLIRYLEPASRLGSVLLRRAKIS
jgi:squalene cyclase